jgi:hypothetical protein
MLGSSRAALDLPQTIRFGPDSSDPMKTAVTANRTPFPEMELLCACISPVRTTSVLDWSFADRSVEWTRFIALATNHHVIPLVHQALNAATRAGVAGIPAEVVLRLRRDYMTIAAYNLRATATLLRLHQLLESNGICLVPIKGPALAALAYGSTSMRQFEDLDIIVPRENLLEAVDLLERKGYVARDIPPTASRKRYLASLQDWSLHKTGDQVHLDLKPVLISHTLCGPRSVDFMVKACRPLAMGEGHKLSAPGPEAMLLAVCLDGANEMWSKLSSIADVGMLLTVCRDADWKGLFQEVGRLGQKRSLLVGARVAELMLGCPLPEAFQAGMRTDSMARRLAETAVKGFYSTARGYPTVVRHGWFTFQTRERMSDRWRFISRSLFVPNAVELNQIHLPAAMIPLYSFMRPFRLAWDVLRRRSRRNTVCSTTGGLSRTGGGM